MIKLQLQLRHPNAAPELATSLRAALEALAMHVDGFGRATVSVHMAPDDYARLFGQPPLASSELPIPAALTDAVSLITVAPPHVATNLNPGTDHAAI